MIIWSHSSFNVDTIDGIDCIDLIEAVLSNREGRSTSRLDILVRLECYQCRVYNIDTFGEPLYYESA